MLFTIDTMGCTNYEILTQHQKTKTKKEKAVWSSLLEPDQIYHPPQMPVISTVVLVLLLHKADQKKQSQPPLLISSHVTWILPTAPRCARTISSTVLSPAGVWGSVGVCMTGVLGFGKQFALCDEANLPPPPLKSSRWID